MSPKTIRGYNEKLKRYVRIVGGDLGGFTLGVNPHCFRQKGRPATDLTSTHPPTSERIRILHVMAGGSFADYEAAYSKVHRGGGGIMPATALVDPETIQLRTATPEAAVGKPEQGRLERTCEVSDLI